MTNKIVIKEIQEQDIAALVEISKATFKETFQHDNTPENLNQYLNDCMSLDVLEHEWKNKDNYFFFAYSNDLLVGYLKLRFNNTPEIPLTHQLEIERIYLLKAFQNKKIGATLMQFALEYAILKQCKVVWLGVWEHNIKAINFYKQWGFSFFGSHIFSVGDDDQVDLLMQLKFTD